MKPFFLQQPRLDEFEGQEKAIAALTSFFDDFKKGKGLFLYGPPGTGKTSSVYAYAKEHGYDILEVNASDARSKKVLEEFLSKATGQMSLFGKKKIILIDEVDGLSGRKDRGAAGAIASAMKSSQFPIVCTGANVFEKKFSPLKKAAELVEFAELRTTSITAILNRHIKAEKLSLSEDEARTIARNAAGDRKSVV